jgi:hypothetical protein
MSASATADGETYEKVLAANLQRAIDFLRFAEVKNAPLLVLSLLVVACTDTMLGHFLLKRT